jgi:hypothetical protein
MIGRCGRCVSNCFDAYPHPRRGLKVRRCVPFDVLVLPCPCVRLLVGPKPSACISACVRLRVRTDPSACQSACPPGARPLHSKPRASIPDRATASSPLAANCHRATPGSPSTACPSPSGFRRAPPPPPPPLGPAVGAATDPSPRGAGVRLPAGTAPGRPGRFAGPQPDAFAPAGGRNEDGRSGLTNV